MKTKTLLSILALGLFLSALSQNTIELNFTAIDSAAYVQLDSIKVMNRTQGSDTVLYYPDTVLVLDYQVGIAETYIDSEGFQVFQNYPNPVADQTTITMFIPEKGKVSIIITDMLGRVILKSDRVLDKGTHSFLFTPGAGKLCFFTAQWKDQSSSIKIIQTVSNSNSEISLEYSGSESSLPHLKATKDIQSFPFNIGDELIYIGYADTHQSGMLDAPEESQDYTFQFATNIPCPGTPTVEYEGQVYNTIQIFSQCWLKENLNVGMMIQGSQEMSENDTIEKYCYDNEPDSCVKYGGLYQWNEMMQYTVQQGTQGICPPGWHLPTDEEWNMLEGAVDSQFGIGDNEWDGTGWRGYDAGTNLKTTSGWFDGGNGTDLFGFSSLPGGWCNDSGIFEFIGRFSYCWMSTEESTTFSWLRLLTYNRPDLGYYMNLKDYGFGARCLRDY